LSEALFIGQQISTAADCTTVNVILCAVIDSANAVVETEGSVALVASLLTVALTS
jgi:hypothetical protein